MVDLLELEAPGNILCPDYPSSTNMIDYVCFDRLAEQGDFVIPCNREFAEGDIVFVGAVGPLSGGFRLNTFVSPTPHTFGANVYENAPNGINLWYGTAWFPNVDVARVSYGAFEVKKYFPLTRRVHIRSLFKDEKSINVALRKAGYPDHAPAAISQWNHYETTERPVTRLSEQWERVVRYLDDHDIAELQKERSKRAA